jgi:predicted nucleotidyltransferase
VKPPSAAADRVRPDLLTDASLAVLRRHGVVSAHLFGSVARHEERPDSDIDLLVTFARDVWYGERLLLSEELSRLCGRRVELVTALHPAFTPYVLPTLVPIAL